MKTKNAIVVHPNSHNYGDDIQSLAAYRLIYELGNSIDYMLDREKLSKKITDDKIRLITNGWFMEKPDNWPPAKNIDPLFISFHVTHNNNASNLLVNKKNYNYFKKHEPIGCRDYHTVELFNNIGIKAYYSGCITLTLKRKENIKSNKIVVVDAFNKNLPKKQRQKMFDNLFPDSIQKNIEIINHTHNSIEKNMNKRLDHASKLLQKYSAAHLVVTSRIHVALPCVALGTPVLFTDVGFNQKNSRNRFDGIIKYFNKLNNNNFYFTGNDPIALLYRKLHLYNYYYKSTKLNFDWDNPPKNPIDIRPIAQNIKLKVKDFLD